MIQEDLDRLSMVSSKKLSIDDAKVQYLRVIDLFRKEISSIQEQVEVEKQEKSSETFYEKYRLQLKQIQKYSTILTEASEVVRKELLNNFDPKRRTLITAFNRQAHRLNMLLPNSIKKRMKASKLLSKITSSYKQKQQEQKLKQKQEQKFEQMVFRLSAYLEEDPDQKAEQTEEQMPDNQRQALKKQRPLQEEGQNHLTEQQKKAKSEYRWFLFKEQLSTGIKYTSCGICILLVSLITIFYLIIRQVTCMCRVGIANTGQY